jgi:murein DD-endopeptidase MepM/ murein hydrolase activator NlpD
MTFTGVDVDIEFKGGTIISYSYSGDIDLNSEAKIEEIVGSDVNLQTGELFDSNKKNLTISFVSNEGLTAEKQAELSKEEKQIQSVINSIAADQDKVEDENKLVENELKAMQRELDSILNASGNASGNVVYNGENFIWPTPTISRISSYFGSRWGRDHNGVDISNGTYGAKVVAIADGLVTTYSNSCKHNYGKKPLKTCCGSGYGNYITINHGTKDGKTYVAYYAHLGSIVVSKGQTVKKGQIVGYVGSTGRSTGAHLHFGISVNGGWKDPMSFYKKVG